MSDFATAFDRALREAIEDGADAALQVALDESSGPFSQPELDAMDNPYAVRHGAPMLDPAVINEQSGEFKEGWRLEQITGSHGEYGERLVNDSEVADLLEDGTSTMFPRPIRESVERQGQRLAEEAVRRAIEHYSRRTFRA